MKAKTIELILKIVINISEILRDLLFNNNKDMAFHQKRLLHRKQPFMLYIMYDQSAYCCTLMEMVMDCETAHPGSSAVTLNSPFFPVEVSNPTISPDTSPSTAFPAIGSPVTSSMIFSSSVMASKSAEVILYLAKNWME